MKNVILDVIIPRFVTEDVVASGVLPNLDLLFPVKDLTKEDSFDYVVRVKSFNLFGLGLFSKVIGYQNFNEYVVENKLFKD